MLEPGAGSGNIIKTLQKYGDFSIDAVEIRPEETEHLQQLGVNVIIGDYLSMNIGKKYKKSSSCNSKQRKPSLICLWEVLKFDR